MYVLSLTLERKNTASFSTFSTSYIGHCYTNHTKSIEFFLFIDKKEKRKTVGTISFVNKDKSDFFLDLECMYICMSVFKIAKLTFSEILQFGK